MSVTTQILDSQTCKVKINQEFLRLRFETKYGWTLPYISKTRVHLNCDEEGSLHEVIETFYILEKINSNLYSIVQHVNYDYIGQESYILHEGPFDQLIDLFLTTYQ